jgi:hypothetical protein
MLREGLNHGNFGGRGLQNSLGAKAGEIPHLATPTPLVLDAMSANSNYSRHLKSLWQGLDVHDEGGRIAPPDMGLCVGNGFILQAVNLVLYLLAFTICTSPRCQVQ